MQLHTGIHVHCSELTSSSGDKMDTVQFGNLASFIATFSGMLYALFSS